MARNILFGYYFARVVKVLAQFRINCLNFTTSNKIVSL